MGALRPRSAARPRPGRTPRFQRAAPPEPGFTHGHRRAELNRTAVTPAKDSNPDALRVVFRGEYVPFLHDSIVKTSTGDKMLFGSELRDRRVGPAFFKWHLSNLLPEEMIKTIKQKAPLDYTKLTGALVRGIRPRVDAKENPKEGEPTEHVLVLHDIVHANEPGKRKDNLQRDVRTKYDKGKYANYKSACLCDVENEHSGQVS